MRMRQFDIWAPQRLSLWVRLHSRCEWRWSRASCTSFQALELGYTKSRSRRTSPPWRRRGGRDIKKNVAKPPYKERTGRFVQPPIITQLKPTTPSARVLMLRDFFLIAQP